MNSQIVLQMLRTIANREITRAAKRIQPQRATARIFASNAFMLVPDFLGLKICGHCHSHKEC